MSVQVVSQHTSDTQRLGEDIGRLLGMGDIVCLYGDLGSGKTSLTQGLARGLGVPPERTVRSPSFVLIQRYQGRVPVYHADLYRLDGPADVEEIGLRECRGGDGVAVIEWADKIETALPAERLDIIIAHQTEHTRLLTLTPRGTRYQQLLRRWSSASGGSGETQSPGGKRVEMTGG
jgi:tRNA threonylcarbamoyladenosine biosynthesis protein TsaE